MAPKKVQRAKTRPFWAISGSGGSLWWNGVEQGWNKSGHIEGDALEQLCGSEVAIWVCHKTPKRVQKGQKWPFWAVSVSVGSILVAQNETRAEQVMAHLE